MFHPYHAVRSLLGGAPFLLLAVGLCTVACGVKRTVQVAVPSKILEAKTASVDELISRMNNYCSQIVSLTSTTMKVSFTAGKMESGRLEAYRSAPGYVLLRRPDFFRMNIQNPLTKTSVVELLSKGDDFSVWYPRENKFFTGKNSTKEFDLEEMDEGSAFTARPAHILEAIFLEEIPLDEPDVFIANEEEQGSDARYYVLSVYKQEENRRLRAVRKIWVERASLTVVRQQIYEDEGKLAGIVLYENLVSMGDVSLPLRIKIDRPVDGYSMDMEFKNWQLNPDLPEDAFVLMPPAGAQLVQLKEKTGSVTP